MLVSELIDRTYSEWLYPGNVSRPAYDKVSTSLGGAPTDLTVVTAGRVTNIPRDSVLEIEDELILVDSVAGATVTAKERGYLETDVAAHAVGTKILIDPQYTRKTIFNALKSIIGLLYPWGIYARTSETTAYTTRSVKTLPTGGKRILSIVPLDTGSGRYRILQRGTDWTQHLEFSPPKYQMRSGAGEGDQMTVVYAKDFVIPTAMTDDLEATCLVPPTLQPYIPMAVAGHLLQGKELPRVQIEEIRRALAAQGVQVGQAMNVGQLLLQNFQRIYVGAEKRRQEELDPTVFEWVRSRG